MNSLNYNHINFINTKIDIINNKKKSGLTPPPRRECKKFDIIKKTDEDRNIGTLYNKSKINLRPNNLINNIGEINGKTLNYDNDPENIIINNKIKTISNPNHNYLNQKNLFNQRFKFKEDNKIKEDDKNIIYRKYINNNQNNNKSDYNIIKKKDYLDNNIKFNDSSPKEKSLLYSNENKLIRKKYNMDKINNVNGNNQNIIMPHNLNNKFKTIENDIKTEMGEERRKKRIEKKYEEERKKKKNEEERRKKIEEERKKRIEEERRKKKIEEERRKIIEKRKKEEERRKREIERKIKEDRKREIEKKLRKEEADNERNFNQGFLKNSDIHLIPHIPDDDDENNGPNDLINININNNDLNFINNHNNIYNNIFFFNSNNRLNTHNNGNNRNNNIRHNNYNNNINNNRYNNLRIVYNNEFNVNPFTNYNNINHNADYDLSNNMNEISEEFSSYNNNDNTNLFEINASEDLFFSRRNGNAGPIKKNVYNLLPENRIKDVSKLDEENKRCTICLEDFINNDNVIFLPCFHIFHKKCIFKWISKDATCPLCKIDINKIIK